MAERAPRPPARHVDLRRAPAWLRYPIALSVVAFVVWLAVRFGGADQPAPTWVTDALVPVLSVVWCGAALWRLVLWWRSRR